MNKLNTSAIHAMSLVSKSDDTHFNLAIWDGDSWCVCLDDIKTLENFLNELSDKHNPNNFKLEGK